MNLVEFRLMSSDKIVRINPDYVVAVTEGNRAGSANIHLGLPTNGGHLSYTVDEPADRVAIRLT